MNNRKYIYVGMAAMVFSLANFMNRTVLCEDLELECRAEPDYFHPADDLPEPEGSSLSTVNSSGTGGGSSTITPGAGGLAMIGSGAIVEGSDTANGSGSGGRPALEGQATTVTAGTLTASVS